MKAERRRASLVLRTAATCRGKLSLSVGKQNRTIADRRAICRRRREAVSPLPLLRGAAYIWEMSRALPNRCSLAQRTNKRAAQLKPTRTDCPGPAKRHKLPTSFISRTTLNAVLRRGCDFLNISEQKTPFNSLFRGRFNANRKACYKPTKPIRAHEYVTSHRLNQSAVKNACRFVSSLN